MKRAKIYYAQTKQTVEGFVIENMEQYRESRHEFFHAAINVVPYIKQGAKVIINQKGGYCFECRDVKILEIL